MLSFAAEPPRSLQNLFPFLAFSCIDLEMLCHSSAAPWDSHSRSFPGLLWSSSMARASLCVLEDGTRLPAGISPPVTQVGSSVA